jgi:cell division protein FtsL
MRNQAEIEALRRRLKILSIVLCILMVRVWETVEGQRLQRRLKTLRVETDRLTYENGLLQMQIHRFEAPSNLEAIAKKDLSMVPLDASHRIGIQP